MTQALDWDRSINQPEGHIMPAAVEVLGNQAAFASRLHPAWHGLGTVFDREVTASEILEVAHMGGWNVRLVPVADATDFGSYAKDYNLVIRDNPFTPGQTDLLAVVGDRYTVVQNEEVFTFGDNLLDGGGRWETAGSIKGGTVIFGSMAFDQQQIVLDPKGRADKIDTYLLVTSSHDGSAPVTVLVTPVRVVCQNTLNVAVKGAKNAYKIRHTLNASGNVAEARKALGVSVAYFDSFSEAAARMIEAEISNGQMLDLVTTVYPKPEEDTKGAVKKWENKVETIESLYHGTGDQGDRIGTATGTVWGAVNAMTERIDYYTTIRSGNVQQSAIRAAGFDDNATRERQKIFDAGLAFIG